jgi:hypothetical protein
MRKALLLGVVAAALAPAALAAERAAPTLKLLDARPLTLRGDHFRGGEKVFVVLRTARPYARSITARADGSFTVQFPGASMRCGRINASARGASGSHAAFATRRVFCTSESIHPPLLPNPSR